jgi:peptidoglycan hydrolase-like protein with peptidoglycan-binding domain
VSKFQQSKGLVVDGKAGPKTLAALTEVPTAQPTAAFAQGGPASPVPEILQRGDRGTEVTNLQNRLKELGYFDGPVTGFFGRLTEDAVFRFQREKGLLVDGKVGPKTVAVLEKAVPPASGTSAQTGSTSSSTTTVLGRGDRGLQVADLQNRLRSAGYFEGPMTGFYGQLTEDAVSKFQQDKGLTVDGKVGPKTLAAIQQLPRSQSQPSSQSSSSMNAVETSATRSTDSAPAASPKPQASASRSSSGASALSPSPAAQPSSPQPSASRPAPQAVGFNAPAQPEASSTEPTQAVASPEASPSPTANQGLKLGDSGVEVAKLQAALKQAGYLKGQVTGFFGKLTEDALIKFQQAQGLPADGVAGPQTQEALRRVIASGVTTNGRESGG